MFATGQALRLTAIRTLGWRWSTRVRTMPGASPVQHSAYLTSAVSSIANALLRERIRREQQALEEDYKIY